MTYGYQDNSGYGGSYPQGNPPPPYGQGEAASYYAGAQQPPQQYRDQQYSPPQGQQYPPPQGQPGYGYGQPPQGPAPDGPDGERGFLGAVGGGVAGGLGGNKIGGKTGHGVLGTVLGVVAGAVAGSKLQDGVSDWKDKRDEEKERKEREEEERKRREKEREEEERRHHYRRHSRSRSRSRSGSAHRHNSYNQSRDIGGVSYAGNFSSSAQDIRLDTHGEYVLHASCRRLDGSYQSSSISLNQIIENDNGSFRWASGRRSGHSGPRQVTVQPGDTLRGIAAQVGTSFDEIARHNNIQNPDMIYPGQVLQVPGGSGGGGGSVGNFGASARDVRLADGGRRLEGELRHPDGHWVGSSIMLDERIGNDNGTLTFVQL